MCAQINQKKHEMGSLTVRILREQFEQKPPPKISQVTSSPS
jgi:hypothetical protein